MDRLKRFNRGDRVPYQDLKNYWTEFEGWVEDRQKEGASNECLADAFGIAHRTFYNVRLSEAMWTSRANSVFWRWYERRSPLKGMDVRALRRLALEFNEVGDRVGLSVLKVSNTWWAQGNYADLGVEVSGEGDQVTVLVLSQDDETPEDDADSSSIIGGEIEVDEEVIEEVIPALEPSGDPEAALLGSDEVASGDEAAPDDDAAPVDDVLPEDSPGDGASDGATADKNLSAGVIAEVGLRGFTRADREALEQRIEDAKTIAEVATIAGAPVLRLVPGLTLEAAKEGALLRVSCWHPGHPKKDPDGVIREYKVGPVGGLWGDGINMLYYGEDAEFEDFGARLVAFAPVRAWGPDSGVVYYAQQMRTGVSMKQRRGKHAVSSHEERPLHVGYRMANWAPERMYPDHDWFFGSESYLDMEEVQIYIDAGHLYEDDKEYLREVADEDIRLIPPRLRAPSRAELLTEWYRVRAVMDAFSGVEGFGSSPFGLFVERARLIVERELLSDIYGITPYYYGKGRSIPDSTRVSERRWMLERINDINAELAAALSRLRMRRFFGALFLGWARGLKRGRYKRRHRKMRKKGIFPGQEGDPVIETEEYVDAGLGVGIDWGVSWENYEAYEELAAQQRYGSVDPETVTGLDYTKWGIPLVIWSRRDLGRWYTYFAPDPPEGWFEDEDAGEEDGESDCDTVDEG